jgi:hypothetical protein
MQKWLDATLYPDIDPPSELVSLADRVDFSILLLMPTADLSPDLDAFIARWRASSAAERANYVLFLSELCSVLDLERPNPQTSDPARDAYVFEKPLPLPHGTPGASTSTSAAALCWRPSRAATAHPNPDREGGERGFPSLMVAPTPRRRGTATRNTGAWDVAMERARRQAETYARSLPPAEVAERPPALSWSSSTWAPPSSSTASSRAAAATTFPSPTRAATASRSKTCASRRCATCCRRLA